MKLGRQWDERLKIWDEAFLPNLYDQLEQVSLSGFVTMDHLSLEQVYREKFEPFPLGTEWGEKWQYAWVCTVITLPEKAEGRRILLHLGAGPEMLVYVNGREVGSIDLKHHFVELTSCGKAGESFEVYAEVYAGHGPRLENGGICTRDAVPVPEPPLRQCKVGESHFGIWDEELFAVYADYHTLYGLWKVLPEDSLRGMKIGHALKEFTFVADFEAEKCWRNEDIIRAGELLKPLLVEKNGPTVPEYTVFGQSHLDLAWLWTLDETKRKSARTYSNQVALMDRYPEYKFLLCEPPVLENLKQFYPSLYERVRSKVKTGQMIPEGAMYVESDTNLAGGESLIRQFVWGKRWFMKEFGVDSQVAWIPDCFGFSGALPQIMAGCRVPYFSTQKLLRCDPECEQFPYNVFWWEGIDGTRILSHIYKENDSVFAPEVMTERWSKDRNQKEDVDRLMFPFGYGDGGGGPTELMVETFKRCKDLEGLPRCRMESPVNFFKRLDADEVENVYYGELYLAWHRGTYTTQGRLKKKTRQVEYALREAEYLTGLLRLVSKDSSKILPQEKLEELWRILLIREFHDILPGTSIQRVNEEALEVLTQVEKECREASKELLKLLAEGEAVFNSLSWERPWEGGVLPVCGYAKRIEKVESDATEVWEDEDESDSDLTLEETPGGGYEIQNSYYRAQIDDQGCIISLVDQVSDFEYVADSLNQLRLYRDVNVGYDAWEIGRMYENTEEPLTGNVTVTAEKKPGEVLITVMRREEFFSATQYIRFGADTPRIDFQTEIDWRERHRLLKVDFPTTVYTKEVLEEIQFGYIKRPTHRSRQYEKDLYETCHHKYAALTDGENGLAILNNGKYGISAKDSKLSLTLLRAPVYPDMTADQGVHSFTYSLLPFRGPFTESGVVEEAYQCNVPVTETSEIAERPAMGKAGKTGRWESVSFFRLEGGHCILETCKPAMDEEKGIILRIYEAHGCAGTTNLFVPSCVKEAFACNMLEERQAELTLEKGKIRLQFRPFEIKTLLLIVP